MDVLQEIQQTSTELVVYIPFPHKVIAIAWPTIDAMRVLPAGIARWLRARGLFWPCFCADADGDALPSRIVRVHRQYHEEIFVACHSYPPQCQFTVNLTRTYRTARLESNYAMFDICSPGSPPNINYVLREFFHRRAGELANGDYLAVYCGEASNEEVDETFSFDVGNTCPPRRIWVPNPEPPSAVSLYHQAQIDARRPTVQLLPPTNVSSARTRIRRRPAPES